MTRTSLPPGFCFNPTDVDLISYYLKRKVLAKPFHFDAITEVQLYNFAPWDLPEKSQICSKDVEWHFFCPQDRKYPNRSKTIRTAAIGYWKQSGKEKSVEYESRTIGKKKLFNFYIGKHPKGNRTNWFMHEYMLEDKEVSDAGFRQDAYALCKVFQKSVGLDWHSETSTVVSLPVLSRSTSEVPVIHISDSEENINEKEGSSPSNVYASAKLKRGSVQNTNEKIYQNYYNIPSVSKAYVIKASLPPCLQADFFRRAWNYGGN